MNEEPDSHPLSNTMQPGERHPTPSCSARPLPPRLECHPQRGMGCIAAFLSLYGLGALYAAFFDPHSTSGVQNLSLALSAFIWLSVLTLVRWQLHARIIANEDGLQWRGLGSWKSATWSQVTRYCVSPNSSATKIIVTESGTLRLTKSHAREALLIQMIEQRAVNVQEKTWHLQDSGLDEGPCEFTYPAPQSDDLMRWMPSLAGAVVFVLLLVMVNYGGLYLIFLPLFLVGTAPLALWLWERYQNAEEVEFRRGQRITVDAEGITFQRSDHTLSAPWNDISDYYLTSIDAAPLVLISHVVETRHGTFEFVHLPHYQRLRRIIARYSTNTAHQTWQRRSTDSDYERHQTEPDGTLVFSYRTRIVRTFLWGAVGLSLLAALLIPVIQWSASLSAPDGHGHPDTVTPVVFLGLYILGCSAIYGFFMASSIRLNEQGITRRTPRGTTFIAWDAVTVLENKISDGGYLVSSETKKVSLSSFRPVDFDFLCAEVARRSGLEWHDKSKNTEQNAALNV